MGHGGIYPTLTEKASDNNVFRIISLAEDAYDRSVAIQRVGNGDYYLSCRRRWLNYADAEWRQEIGEYETFQMITVPRDNSVIFKSHNDLYLAVNETIHTCQFKTCSSKDEFDLPLKGRWEILDCSKPRAGDRDGQRNTARSILRNGVGGGVGAIGTLKDLGEVAGVVACTLGLGN